MSTVLRVLLVDDEESLAESVQDLFDSMPDALLGPQFHSIEFDVCTRFDRALDKLTSSRYDLVILDIIEDASRTEVTSLDLERIGVHVFQSIRARQFVPVIFYAGDPTPAHGSGDTPFVQYVNKGNRPDELREAVSAVAMSGLPATLRAINGHVDAITRSFMLDFVEAHWSDVANDVPDIGYLLARHLSNSFVDGADDIAQSLTEDGTGSNNSAVHPHRYYMVPLRQGHTMGDVYCRRPRIVNGQSDVEQNALAQEIEAAFGATEFLISLTPSCDLVGLDDQSTRRPKAEFVLVARCLVVVDLPEFSAWTENQSAEIDKGELSGAMKDVLRSQRRSHQSDRFYFLPRAWSVPDLLVDLQQSFSLSSAGLLQLEKVASLDSPFAESLSQRFSRLMARIGTPDLDIDLVAERIWSSTRERGT